MTLTYIICLCLPPFLFDGAALHCPKETPFERFTNLFHEKAPIRYHTNNFLIYEVYELESLCLWKSVSKSIQNNFPSFWTIRDHIISEINSSLPSINTSNTLRFQNGSESVKCVSVLSGLTSLSTQLHPILYQIQRLYKQRGCHARIQQQYDMNEMDDVKLRRFFSTPSATTYHWLTYYSASVTIILQHYFIHDPSFFFLPVHLQHVLALASNCLHVFCLCTRPEVQKRIILPATHSILSILNRLIDWEFTYLEGYRGGPDR